MVELFGEVIGMFRGFADSELEFRAELISPYLPETTPLIGEFMLVDVSGNSALLGRITRFTPVGVLSGPYGDEYLATLSRMRQIVPEDIKESKLRYNVSIKLLGTIHSRNNSFDYEPGVRELPHLGANVAKVSNDVLEFICSLGCDDDASPVSIGHLALGNRVFDGKDLNPKFEVMFDLNHLVEKRSFVFSRSGYGKSNLVKLLVSRLFEQERDVGMLIFDPEGEYAFEDFMGRPGLTDLPHLRDRVVVYTDQHYNSEQTRFIQGPARVNLSNFHSSVVVNQCINPSKLETIFALRLKGMSDNDWRELVDLLNRDGYSADENRVASLTNLDVDRQGTSVYAIISNLVPIIHALHRNTSNMMNSIKYHLRQGHIVIVDVRSHSRSNSEKLAGLILNQIFQYNQRNFQSEGETKPIRTILVLEEAQSVLSPNATEESPFVKWAKEGRKYGLGAVMITQQPGAIARELLSQGDNFFAFHLISASDLNELRYINSHFSKDILTQIINEPIKGNCYYWSAPDQPFVLCARIHKFEDYARSAIDAQEPNEEKVLTAVEEYREKCPSMERDFDNEIKRAILEVTTVKLFNNITIDGRNSPDVIAVKFWNLSFGIADLLEESILEQYGVQFRDGKWFIQSSVIEASLRRLGFISDLVRGYDDEGTEYLLIQKSKIEEKLSKAVDDTGIRLTSGSRTSSEEQHE